MMNCSPRSMSFQQKKKYFQVRRLEMLKMMKEAIERRLSAIEATISTLEHQIKNTEGTEEVSS